MAAEEFFMYLIIALVLVIPISVRVHRYLMRERTAKKLREQFGETSAPGARDERRS